ncbi:MAG: tetratricopeptide repeat protein [Pseudomonadota bacterium]|nr:tetratricopeptide repeat protein [Pseudomonadota bacterium]
MRADAGWLLCLAGAAALVAADGELPDAVRAYHEGRYATARALLRDAARDGSERAQIGIGWLHQQGLGGDRDPQEALRWYRRAAESGSPEAQYQVGLMHELGIGVEADPWEAETWYGRAIEQGYCPGELAGPEQVLEFGR